MLEFLDLQWVHWPSAIFGVVLFFGLGCGAVATVTGGWHLVQWLRRRWGVAVAEDGAVEEVRTFDAEHVRLPRRRRQPQELGLYLPTAPKVPSARHSPILDRDESNRLWMLVNGDKAL